jgi:hypothetical protein
LPSLGRFRFCKNNILFYFKYINHALVYEKLDIVAKIFGQANFGKSFDKNNIFIRLKAILDALTIKYALFFGTLNP